MNICILGRQPEISNAELEALYGASVLTPLSPQATLCSAELLDINRLGGTQKIAQHLLTIESSDWVTISRNITKSLQPEDLFTDTDHKFSIGVSVYGLDANPKDVTGLGLQLKKNFKKQGRKIRVVPNKEAFLSSAQVFHNQLENREKGAEIIVVSSHTTTYVGVTVGIQDIDAYSERDQARPARDAYVGMLPPKLAQVILNLATQQHPPQAEKFVLDPFCGTGVLLQEALLAGWSVIGSDISPAMHRASEENMQWLREKHTDLPQTILETGDATEHTWEHTPDFVACEMYLGEPQSSKPSPQQLHSLMKENEQLLTKFLENVAGQIQPGTTVCVATPAWKTHTGFECVDMVDHLKKIGYTQQSFQHSGDSALIYARDDQITGRRLLVLTKN